MKNEYAIDGDVVTIFLQEKNGERLVTLIDTEDFEKVDSFPNRWFLCGDYVTGHRMINKKVICQSLHRLVMGNPENMRVDHIYHNTKDNRKSKLRILTNAENMQNIRGNYSTNTSGYRGVYWEEDRQKWRVRLKINSKRITVGRYETYEEALKIAQDYVSKHMPYSQEALAN